MFSKLFLRLFNPISKQFVKTHVTNSIITSLKRLTPPMLLWSGIVVDHNDINQIKTDKIIKIDENNVITDEMSIVNYTSVLAEDFLHNEQNIKVLIKTLGEAIANTCEKYRKSIDQQIDVIDAGRGLNPLDTYWDSLVTYKQTADKIKAEFEKFSALIKFVEQLSSNLSNCYDVLNDINPTGKPSCDEFCKLENTLQMELKKNSEKEQLLKKYLWNKYMDEDFYW